MKHVGMSTEELAQEQETGNRGTCPACGHELPSETWFSLMFPGEEGRWIACPWCVDVEMVRQKDARIVAEIERLVEQYRRGEP